MKEHVVFIKLDLGLRQAIDDAAIAFLDVQNSFLSGSHPSVILKSFVFFKIRMAFPELTRNAVCRYDPFRGILSIRYGNLVGGNWIDGSNRPVGTVA